jgi:hypothetical protein
VVAMPPTQSPGERPSELRRVYLQVLGGLVRAFYAAGLPAIAGGLARAAKLALNRPPDAPSRCQRADPDSKLYAAYQQVSRQFIWRCGHDYPHCYQSGTMAFVDCE